MHKIVIVLDSNIFISALIKDSITRKLIINCKELIVIPEFLLEEIRNYEEEIILKSKLDKEEYKKLLNILLKYVLVLPDEIILPYREQAVEIIKDIDINDVLFIATALAFGDATIWSNDKKLKKQNKIKVISTQEIMQL